jgi:NAD(P)-dependent dehydrogenase (short-subunit alcohol dehydrogenase family)
MGAQALVVGAAGGVGLEVTKQLAAAGYRVVSTVMDAAQRDALLAAVPEIAGIAIIDLAQADGIAAGLAPLLDADAPLDAVAVCAAISPYGPIETTPLSALRRTFEINTFADVAVYQAVMPHLRRTKGRLAMISSMAGRVAFPFLGAYSASKFALEALADVMRREAAKWGVDVILVEPGGIQTGMVTDQQKTIVRDKAALTHGERALYGDLYDAFEKAVHGGYDSATPPAAVAAVIVRALTAPEKPEARYPVGPDAEYLCAASRTRTDRELDMIARLETANATLNEAASA